MPTALEDIAEISLYISQNSIYYSEVQVDRFFEAVIILENNPLAGKIVLEINKEDIRQINEGNYRIIYRIVNKEIIHILMVWHGARKFKKKFLPK